MILAQSEGMGAATKEMLNYGVLGALVVLGIGGAITVAVCLLRWLKPWIDKIGESIVRNIDSNTTNVQVLTSNSDKLTTLVGCQRKAMGHFGEALVEAAPDDKQQAVRHHIQRVHDALNDNG